MRWYEEFPQPADAASICPLCKSETCRNAPTVREKERSEVLAISRAKMEQHRRTTRKCVGSDSDGGIGSTGSRRGGHEADLRCIVAVKNTVKRLEKDMHAEIMAAFSQPGSMG